MEIAPIFNTAVVATAATSSTSSSTSQQKPRQRRRAAVLATAITTTSRTQNNAPLAICKESNSNPNDNVNNLALLASLTLQKVLNINNINNNNINNNSNNHIHNNTNNIKNGTRSDSATSYQQLSAVAKATTAALKLQQQEQQQQQRRHSDNEAENDVLNQLLKTGAVFTTTTTSSSAASAAAVTPTGGHSAPIAIDKKTQQHKQKQQQQQQQQNHGNSAQKQRLNSSISSTNSSTSSNSLTANSYGSSCSSSEEPMTALSTSKSTGTITSNSSSNNHNNKSSSIKLPEKSKIPSDILDDLASRFIINVPDMELNNLIRICFQIELAHWFYLDFFCAPAPDADPATQQQQQQLQRKLPIVGIKQFAMQVFQHIPFLNKHFGTVDQILEDWKNYKLSVPTYGAILVSEDLNHCLLVQSYFARNSWGFPKGKINEHENPAHCATREVYEETGFDITKIIDADDYIEALINYQYTRLYIVRNIPLDTQFAPRTRNEIKCCDWFRIDALPVNKNDAISKAKLGKNSNSFFMIMPFVKRLKKWVNDRRNGIEPSTTRRHKSSGQHSPRGILGAVNSTSPTMLTNNSNNSNGNKKEQTSRRQRHKSMGDLDGVKLNNLNGKPQAGAGCNGNALATSNICNGSNIKRNSNSNSNSNNKQLNVAAGSNTVTSATTTAVPGTSSSALWGATTVAAGPITSTTVAAATAANSKRQLFHSQSQNDAQQPASNEKVSDGKPIKVAENAKQKQLQIVSSFDLIRKEKQQQLKAAKAQKQQQQQQQQQQQRSRTKSQSDKQSNQQQPMVVKSILTKSNTQLLQQQQQQQQPQQQQSTPTTGIDLIAMLTAAAAAQKTPNPEQQQQQRPRPASVSLNSPIAATVAAASNGSISSTPDAETLQKLQRMASGTNLRILKRAQSHQPLPQQQQLQLQQIQQQQQQQSPQQPLIQQQQQQQGPLNFTPSFNSWTNFSFTKNFIANVFC